MINMHTISKMTIFVFCACVITACSAQPSRMGQDAPVQYELGGSSLPLNLKWVIQLDETVWNPLILQGSRRIFVRTDAAIYAIESATGQILWKHSLSNAAAYYDWNRTLVPHDHLLIAATAGETELSALDGDSGQVLWTAPVAKYISGKSGKPNLTQILSDDKQIYVLVNIVRGVGVVALDPATGNLLWKAPPEIAAGTPFALYLVPDSAVLAVDTGAVVYFLDRSSGSVVDSISREILSFRPPTYTDGVLFTSGRQVAAYTIKSLKKKWSFEKFCPSSGDQAFISPVVFENAAYILTTCQTLYKLNAENGQLQWYGTYDAELESFAIFQDRGYLLTSDGTLHALNIATGESIGKMLVKPAFMPSNTSSHLTTDGKFLFLSYGNNQIFAFQPN